MLKIGSLCSGYGGLDMAVEAYFNAETVWMCDNDKYASVVIKERWNLPNLGDLKAVDWTTVEPIDILTAGYPCQPFSQAGQRKGIEDERHIWPYIKQIISATRPKYIILENVRGHLSLGFKEVLKDLAQIGYDAKWRIVRASDVGAPHQRARLFIVAYSSGKGLQGTWNEINDITTSLVADTNSNPCEELRRAHRSIYGTPSQIINRSNRQERGLGFEITEREIPPTLVENKLKP
jgi:DNA (cytosine-5)-methyltransferase 1